MNLNRARYILKICEAGGVTAAARLLFISQPSLSQTIRQVEQEMGVKIFVHGSNPPELTYAGEQYVAAAKIMLAQEDNLNNILDSVRHERQGRLRIGISMQRGMQLLPQVLPEFRRLYPLVQLTLEEKGSGYLEEMVEEGVIDLALATTEPTRASLHYDLIENEAYGILTGKGNPLTQRYAPGSTLHLEDLGGETFIALKPGHNTRGIQDRAFLKQGITPRILTETDSLEGAMRIAINCSCCMICPQVFYRNDPSLADRGVYYDLADITEPRHFYACYPVDKYLPIYLQDFIRLVKGTASQEPRR